MGGGGQATGLMNRNRHYEFLGPADDVISILDGDLRRPDPPRGVHYIPLLNVEQALWDEYRQSGFPHRFEGGELLHPKKLYQRFTSFKMLVPEEFFTLLCDRHDTEMTNFAQTLREFLCRSPSQ
jgi:hypothetical protein